MNGQIPRDIRTTRLRAEGRSIVFTIPAHVTRELGLKSGDLLIVRAGAGAMIAVKVDLHRAVTEVSKHG